MAIYHLNASTGSKAGGQSAAAKADYLARAGRYSREREEVAHVESGNMPEWVGEGRGRATGAALDYLGALFRGLVCCLEISDLTL